MLFTLSVVSVLDSEPSACARDAGSPAGSRPRRPGRTGRSGQRDASALSRWSATRYEVGRVLTTGESYTRPEPPQGRHQTPENQLNGQFRVSMAVRQCIDARRQTPDARSLRAKNSISAREQPDAREVRAAVQGDSRKRRPGSPRWPRPESSSRSPAPRRSPSVTMLTSCRRLEARAGRQSTDCWGGREIRMPFETPQILPRAEAGQFPLLSALSVGCGLQD